MDATSDLRAGRRRDARAASAPGPETGGAGVISSGGAAGGGLFRATPGGATRATDRGRWRTGLDAARAVSIPGRSWATVGPSRATAPVYGIGGAGTPRVALSAASGVGVSAPSCRRRAAFHSVETGRPGIRAGRG